MLRSCLRSKGVWISAAVMLASCSKATSEPVDQDATQALFAPCSSDEECSSGLCTFLLYASDEPGVCTKTCADDADCHDEAEEEATCRQVPVIPELGGATTLLEHERACLLPCYGPDPQGAYDCQDGVRVFCEDAEAASHASCEVCGCPSHQLCGPDDRCVDYGHGGDACRSDRECFSGLCQDGACTSGQGDPCSPTCDGTCGGPPDGLYCLPQCTADGRCPVDQPFWECIHSAMETELTVCAHVCNDDQDCPGDGDLCEVFVEATGNDWTRYFTGYCRQPTPAGD